ncbi:hypothetical protein [Acutalibacter sp. 1XD8-33]|uniref:hypothetical protein n=1 Tax=Acutalibacter sp. 1XD8-33 TaxID=2320081 RepID=UPI0011C44D47|nr:hypothetical protein [Acutalibacter sp. 1XD8-33]
MKKVLTVLAAILLVSLLALSASAADEDSLRASLDEMAAIESTVDSSLEGNEYLEALRQAYVKAGWKDTSNDLLTASHSVDPETEELAYRDLEAAATEEEKEAILAARNAIIADTTWGAGDGWLVDPVKKEFAAPPTFQELFPVDWEVPAGLVECAVPEETVPSEEETAEAMLAMSEEFAECVMYSVTRSTPMPFNQKMYIRKFVSGSGDSPSFCSVATSQARDTYVYSSATKSYQSGLTSVNIGYSDNRGGSLGYVNKTPIGVGFRKKVNGTMTTEVHVRVSTHTTAGYAQMFVGRELAST